MLFFKMIFTPSQSLQNYYPDVPSPWLMAFLVNLGQLVKFILEKLLALIITTKLQQSDSENINSDDGSLLIWMQSTVDFTRFFAILNLFQL